MQNLQEELIKLLEKVDNYTVDGQLNKTIIVEAALKVDPTLIGLLIKSDAFKKHFFKEVEGVLVFDKIEFQRFVNNKSFLPDSYTAFKNKIGLTINDESLDNYITSRNDVVLAWPHKDCVLEGGQTKEDQKRNEIFWNETLAPDNVDRLLSPKAFTNFKRYEGVKSTKKEKSEGLGLETESDALEIKETELNGKENIEFSNENLIIKGNNLLALASLLKTHRGKIKLIYIDPPYNTGSDSFGYNDKFNHSTWLTFMKNRLVISKELLSKEGFICCHIDDNEGAYLNVLMDEVFGRDNFLTKFNIRVRYPDKTLKQDMNFHKEVEHVLIYQKSNLSRPNLNEKESNYDKYIFSVQEISSGEEIVLGGKKVIRFKPDQYKITKGKPNKEKRKEIWASGSILDGNSSGRFFRDYLTGRYEIDGYGVLYKVYGVGDEIDGFRYFTGPNKVGATKGKYFQGVPSKHVEGEATSQPINNYYDFAGSFGNCRHEGGVELRSGKKPEKFLQTIIEHFSDEGDTVLDYHLGSGSTFATSIKMRRNAIGVEQLDYSDNDSVVRIKNVLLGDQTGISKDVNWKGGGAFSYLEIMPFNQTYIDKIQAVKTKEELLSIWQEMKEKAMLSYLFDADLFDERLDAFKTASLEDMKKYLVEILDKNQLYVNYSEIEDNDYQVSPEDIALNHQFYKKK